MTDQTGVEIHRPREHVAVLILNRPRRHNTLDLAMWDALDAALEQLEQALPRALVITGAGDKAFSAGMDVNPDNPQIAGLIDGVQRHDRAPGLELLRRLRRSVDRLAGLPVPVIAALNGLAYGGGAELAARCDLRVADPAAVISFSEVRLGLMPDWGGGPALARLVHWAGLLGSRVLLSSATLPPALVQGLFSAYLAGRGIYQSNRGIPEQALNVCCAWFDEFGVIAGEHSSMNTFMEELDAFIQKRLKKLGYPHGFHFKGQKEIARFIKLKGLFENPAGF